MSDRLKGKIIVVAGAGGIGTGLTCRYASEGARVVVGDISLAAAETAAHQAASMGGIVEAVRLDGSNEDDIAAAVSLAMSKFGGLDGFHANFASFLDNTEGEDVVGMPMEVFDEVMRVNMRGFVLCTRYAVPPMLDRGGGSILYTSSAAAFAGQPVKVAYSMSKLAGHALMRHVAARYGPDGIRANAMTPGIVTHASFEQNVPKEWADSMIEVTPRRRLGLPSDVAALSTFLMSDEANFITGQLFSVDGGRTMRQ